MLSFSESIVSLCNLPDMRVYRHRLSPAESHKTDAVGDFRPNALQLNQLLMRISGTLSSAFNKLTGRKWKLPKLRLFWIAQAIKPVEAFGMNDIGCLPQILGSITKS